MKFTARVYWARIALVVAVLGVRAAEAQQVQDAVTRQYLISRGAILYDDGPSLAALAALQPPLPPVVIKGGKGGSIPEHISRFGTLGRSGAPVEMRGGCYSCADAEDIEGLRKGPNPTQTKGRARPSRGPMQTVPG